MAFLSPQNIAVIGASHQPGKVGHDIFKNLCEQGFKGNVYPVNPKGEEILGRACFKTIAELPDSVDLAIVVVPAAGVPQVLRECAAKKILQAVIISAGFGETGTDEGHALEEELKTIAKETGMKIIGPNCLGILRPSIGMNASFAKDLPAAGGIGLFSQSGATMVAIMDASEELGLSFSSMLSIGNKTVMDECDMLEMLRDDPETTVIGCYLESIHDGQRFRSLSAEITKTKPVVLLKAGVSSQGQRAVSSHTGALAGSDKAIGAVCAQCGIRRAHDLEEFFDLLSVLSTQPPLPTDQIAVVTNAGGPGILATDAAERNKLSLVTLSKERADNLRKVLPPAASVKNPVDVLGDAGDDRYAAALKEVIADPGVDGVVALLTPQVMTPVTQIAQSIIDAAKKNPLIPVAVSFVGGSGVQEGVTLLRKNRIPCFPTPERAVRAMAMLRPCTTSGAPSAVQTPKTSILAGKTGLLSEDETKELFGQFNLPLPRQLLATTKEEAAAFAEKLGGKVVLKISAPEILHKTDMGGVRIGLAGDAVGGAFGEILANAKKNAPQAHVRGVLVQEMLPPGHEFIVGGLRDPSFGPMVMVGLGGIYAELFKDTSFRLAPVTAEDTYEMLEDLQSWKLLLGMRGAPPDDIDGLAALIVNVSRMMIACPEISELDCNPAIVRSDGIVIADAKVVLG